MRILVVYEEVPESTFLAVLEVTPEQLERYKVVAGKIVNFTQNMTQAECDTVEELSKLVRNSPRDLENTRSPGHLDAIIFTGFGL